MSLGLHYALSWVQKRYESMGYEVTLTPTPENFMYALDVYSYGKHRHLPLIPTLHRFFGYRYRRMENFLRECGLWEPIGGGWVQELVEIHVYQYTYVSSKPEPYLIHVENVFKYYKPLHLVDLDDMRVVDFTGSVLDYTDFWGVPIELEWEEADVGYEAKTYGYIYPSETQNVTGVVTVKVEKPSTSYTYIYSYEADIYNYYFFKWGLGNERGFEIRHVSQA